MHTHDLCRLVGLALLPILALSGCGTEETDSTAESDGNLYDSFNFDDNDAAYGASLREDTSYAIALEYDKRFFEDGELEALTSYYDAIQENDTSLFHTYAAAFYMDYCFDTLYGGLLDESAYLVQQQGNYQEIVDATDFTFTKIAITDCEEAEETDETEESSTISADGIPALEDLYIEQEGQESFDANWNGCKRLTIDLTVSNGDTETVMDSLEVYVVQLDGAYYICA